jgi:hypothetical protein
MTLIMSWITPHGSWQSVDYLVTRGNVHVKLDEPKQLSIHCGIPLHEGNVRMLLGYTGLAEFPDGTPTIRWIRNTLRGFNRTHVDTLAFLIERLDRDLGQSQAWRNVLIFSVIIHEPHTGKRFHVHISNIGPGLVPVRKFSQSGIEVVPGGAVFVPSNPLVVTAAVRQRLERLSFVRPNKPSDYQGLLAVVNRRFAAKNAKAKVSKWCKVSYMSNEGTAVETKVYRERTDPPLDEGGMGMIFRGFDMTDISAALSQGFRAQVESGGANPIDQLLIERLGREATEGRP